MFWRVRAIDNGPMVPATYSLEIFWDFGEMKHINRTEKAACRVCGQVIFEPKCPRFWICVFILIN